MDKRSENIQVPGPWADFCLPEEKRRSEWVAGILPKSSREWRLLSVCRRRKKKQAREMIIYKIKRGPCGIIDAGEEREYICERKGQQSMRE